MLINGIWFNVDHIKNWSFDHFKDIFEKAGWKSTGLTVEQLAKKLGVTKDEVVNEPSK